MNHRTLWRVAGIDGPVLALLAQVIPHALVAVEFVLHARLVHGVLGVALAAGGHGLVRGQHHATGPRPNARDPLVEAVAKVRGHHPIL